MATNGAVVIDMADPPAAATPAAAAATGATTAAATTAANTAANGGTKDKEKKQDPLFGPNIGIIPSGPAWTVTNEKKLLNDELTRDVVKSWIRKSKLPAQATTTLQALVNLKRPTLKLSPLHDTDSSSTTPLPNGHTLHGVEFEFDCDAPKCGIYISTLIPSTHPDAPKPPVGIPGTNSKVLVFETVVPGGFGRHLELSQGAVLDLARFDCARTGGAGTPDGEIEEETDVAGGVAAPTTGTAAAASADGTSTSTSATATAAPAGRSRRRRFTSHFNFLKRPHHNRTAAGPALAVVDVDPNAANNNAAATAAHGAGTNAAASGAKKSSSGDDEDSEGVRVMIRLAALGEDGTELESVNEQVTYLHVVRLGAKPAPTPTPPPAAPATAATTASPAAAARASADGNTEPTSATDATGEPTAAAAEGDGNAASASGSGSDAKNNASGAGVVEEVVDNRPWVVKVVKREATIGPHTFHLHEIYGLSSSSSTTTTTTSATPSSPTTGAPLQTQNHTYPPPVSPVPATAPAAAPTNEEDPISECLLCLSSPREVVLLPCRHLVACKECAINMVEFGAGGTVQAPTETTTTAVAGADGGADAAGAGAGAGAGEGGAAGGITVGPTPITPTTNRRRKKAKGWFCPVCRQPYTSLLRITTTPPPPVDEATMALALKEAGAVAGAGGEEVGSPTVESAASPTTPAPTGAGGAGTVGTIAAPNANANANATANAADGSQTAGAERQGGVARLFSLRRPGFLNRNSSSGSARARDVEAQA